MKHYREIAAPENYPKGIGEDFATMDIDKFVDNLLMNTTELLIEVNKCSLFHNLILLLVYIISYITTIMPK